MTSTLEILKSKFYNLKNDCDKFSHYFPIYDSWLSKYVGKSPNILEIGVDKGGSAELWSEYFGNKTQVTGIDIDIKKSHSTKYLGLVEGDQGDCLFWDDFLGHYTDACFDIIFDDGSHKNSDQILTLEKAYPYLKSGGIYVCEDTHTSYYNNERINDGGLNSPKSFTEYCKKLIDVINHRHTHFAIGVGETKAGPHVDEELIRKFNGLFSVNFYDSVIVIQKTSSFIPLERINSNCSIKHGPDGCPPDKVV